MNVEGGCATGSMTLHGAVKDVLSGSADFALAVGVEKTYRPDAPVDQTMAMFRAGENAFNPEETLREYEHLAELTGRPLEFGPDRTMFMDTYAAQASYHMHRFGTTQQQIAAVAAKNHTNGTANPLAQYRFPMTVEQVLADREVSYPLTRSMCAPIGDGYTATRRGG
jgi:acetyl-CoA acetyltransferase